MLAAGVPFDAIFTGDDEAAVGAMLAVEARGLRIPEAVSVVGFDDQRLATILHPPLTTVRAPTERVGMEAARQLLKLIGTVTLIPTLLLTERLPPTRRAEYDRGSIVTPLKKTCSTNGHESTRRFTMIRGYS
jgi:DNA-binding LacI/PurR family transcriptional regulator